MEQFGGDRRLLIWSGPQTTSTLLFAALEFVLQLVIGESTTWSITLGRVCRSVISWNDVAKWTGENGYKKARVL